MLRVFQGNTNHMSATRNMTIKDKLISIIMSTCIAALLSVSISFVIYERIFIRRNMVKHFSTQAAMIADTCKAALAFEDVLDAEEGLKALRAEPSIVYACIYSADDKIFARYQRNSTPPNFELFRPKGDGYQFGDGFLAVHKGIILDEEKIGTVVMWSDLQPLKVMFKHNTTIVIAAVGLAVFVAYLVSHRLQRIISVPIQNLTDVARTVSEKNEYSTRALKHSNDEVGMLIDSFNNMLEQIQQRDSALVSANEQLEARVQDRTAKLTAANEQLTTEVAERKKAEERQAHLLDQLEKANKELKDFAYIVSHDLKAPLRGIKTLADWIASDYSDKIDDDGKENIKLLLSRVDRMQSLIDGILQYSRVGRVREEVIHVDINQAVADIIDMIAPPENITINVVRSLPVIECEPTRITQIFQNLLSNAVKYMDKPQGHIRVGCVEDGSFWKFSIADNGPGIDEKHFEKIFQMFQTLSPRDEFESTGVGLTVVKKIIEMYGGKIWVESIVGEGSTFFFTLPKQKVRIKDEKLQTNTVS